MLKSNDFLTATAPVRHEIDTPVGQLIVYVKPLSWLQQQEAISTFVDFEMDAENKEMIPRIDFGGYWAYILKNCITETEPKITKKELQHLSPEVGKAVVQVLPSLEDLMGELTTGEPAPLE